MTPKPKTAIAKSKRYPIFPVRLRPDDKQVMKIVVERYGLGAISDSIRLCTRIVQMLDLPMEKVVKLNSKFEAENPEALSINIDLPAS